MIHSQTATPAQTLINLYPSFNITTTTSTVTLEQLLTWIKLGRSEEHRTIITKIRTLSKATHKSEIDLLKKKLSYVHTTFNARRVKSRKLDSVKSAEDLTGYHFFDIDGIKEEELQTIYTRLRASDQVTAVWLSSSGKGLGGLLKIEWLKNVLNYTKELNPQADLLLNFVWAKLGFSDIVVDPAGFRVTQGLYVSYDPSIHYNSEAVVTVPCPTKEELVQFSTERNPDAKLNSPKRTTTTSIKSPSVKRYSTNSKKVQPFQKVYLDRIYTILLKQSRLYKTNVLPEDSEDLTTLQSNLFVSNFVPRAFAHSIPVEVIKTYLRSKNKRFINNDSVEGISFKEGTYGWDTFITNHSPAFITDTIILKPEEWLSSVFCYDRFKSLQKLPKVSTASEDFKVIINATTGLGKNVAVIKNAVKHKTIIAVPSNSLEDSIVREASVQAPNLIVKKYDGRTKDKNLYTANLVVTTYNSLSKVIEVMDSEGVDVYSEYLLVVDELHTLNYDSFKELAGAKAKPLSNLIEEMEVFNRVVGLTGTLNSNTIKAFEEWAVLNVRRAVPALKTQFCYMQKEAQGVKEDVHIVKQLVKEGYFPVIFKNNKSESEWFGEFRTLLKYNGKSGSENFTVACLNTDYTKTEVSTKAYDQIIKNGTLNASYWDAVLMTSFVREGVSTNLIDHSTGKVAYVLFFDANSPFDTDMIQQVSQRVRNAKEVKVVVVYGAGVTLSNKSYFKYDDAKAKVLKEADKQLKLVDQLFGKKMTSGVRAERLSLFPKNYLHKTDSAWEVNSLYTSWELTRRRCLVEGKNPVYMAWVGNYRFGWEDLGQALYDRTERFSTEEAVLHKKLSKIDSEVELNNVCANLSKTYNMSLVGVDGKRGFIQTLIEKSKEVRGTEARVITDLIKLLKYVTIKPMTVVTTELFLGSYDFTSVEGTEEEVSTRLTTGLLNNRDLSKIKKYKALCSFKVLQNDFEAGLLNDGDYDLLFNDLFTAVSTEEAPVTFANRQELVDHYKLAKYFVKYNTHYKYNLKERVKLSNLIMDLYYKIIETGKTGGVRRYSVEAQDFFQQFEKAGFVFKGGTRVSKLEAQEWKSELQTDDTRAEEVEVDIEDLVDSCHNFEEVESTELEKAWLNRFNATIRTKPYFGRRELYIEAGEEAAVYSFTSH